MGKVRIIGVILCFLFSITVMAEDKQAGSAADGITLLPRDLEIELALSSLPPHLRDGATVYVFNPDKGYEVARKGTNEFHAFVGRTDPHAFIASWALTEYPDDILIPISFDGAGAKANMRVHFDVAEMRAGGTAPGELKRIVNERFKTGYYKAPDRAGVSYMLSPVLRAYRDPTQDDTVMTFNIPHYMFYAPNVSNEDIGGKFPSQYPFIIFPGPHGFIIQLTGEAEKVAINKEYEEMLVTLCGIKEVYCVPKQNGN